MNSHCTLFLEKVAAGFPSPAADYAERPLDLNEHLITHQAATFFVRSTGDSMIGAGIHSGDLLIVDRAVTAENNAVVLAVIDGEFTVKRLKKEGGTVMLQPENKCYPVIRITEDTDFTIWGVVTTVIHSLTNRAL